MAGPTPDIDGLDVAGLRRLLLQVLEENAALRAEVAALREEVRRLKGLKGPPAIKPSKPSGMDKATEAKPRGRNKRRRGAKNARLTVDEVQVVRAEVPPGSRFKGYEDFVVQDLVIRPRVIRYRRERWLTPGGMTVVAPLPPGTLGHFGPELRRFVLALYHQGQSTVERITTVLADIGMDISKRQVQRFLTGQEGFLAEARAVLRTGLATAAWISVDDTGARHDGRNATCTRIGDARFTSFATTPAKSRLNFLELLAGAEPAYTVNAEALAYMRKRQLPEALIARLAARPERSFRDRAAWDAHLAALAIPVATGSRDPARVASEGALWGGLAARGFENTVILSDDAGQFNVGRHALCWVHAERLVHKLDTFCDRQTRAKETVQAGLWDLYRDFKAYAQVPVPTIAAALRQRFDRLVATRTGFATLDRLLDRLKTNRHELLVALDRPEVPLHTNDAENDLRAVVTRRKLSGGTRSAAGRACRDALLGLSKTCAKLDIRFWDYLGARLRVPGAASIPDLDHLIRQAAPA
jgi:Transposase IS66 family